MLILTVIFGCILVLYGVWSHEVHPHACDSMQMRTRARSHRCLHTARSHELWTTTEGVGSGRKRERQK